jgi:hypothetical protein
MSTWSEKFFPKPPLEYEQNEAVSKIYEDFADLAFRCEQTLPDGRYKSLVLTHLEIAAAFATKAFTHGE